MESASKLVAPIVAERNEAEIVRSHDSRIKALAARFPHVTDRKDLEQIGRIALLKAARRWIEDHASSAKIWTFARPAVFGAMLTHATKAIAIACEEVSDTVRGPGGVSGAFEGCDPFQGVCEATQEESAELAEALDALSDDERAVIALSLEGFGLVEVAEQTHRSKSEVHRIYRRAVRKMQQTLTGEP